MMWREKQPESPFNLVAQDFLEDNKCNTPTSSRIFWSAWYDSLLHLPVGAAPNTPYWLMSLQDCDSQTTAQNPFETLYSS